MKYRRHVVHTLILYGLLNLPGAVAAGPWHAANDNTSGWTYMTPEERIEHQRRMRSFESYGDCKIYQTEHHGQMAARARAQGVELRPRPGTGCEQLRRRGEFQ